MHPVIEQALNDWRNINSTNHLWARLSIEQFDNREPIVRMLLGPKNQVAIGMRDYYMCGNIPTYITKVWS